MNVINATDSGAKFATPNCLFGKRIFFKLKTIKTQKTQEETLPFPLTASEEFRKRAYQRYYQRYLQKMWAMCGERSSECSTSYVLLSLHDLANICLPNIHFSIYKLIAFIPYWLRGIG